MTLSSKERAFLKKLAHNIDPVVRIGKDGVDDALAENIANAVKKRELIKIKILQNSEVELTRDLCEDIAKKTKSTFVDSIGRVIILFKPNSKEGKLAKEFKEFKDKAKKGKKWQEELFLEIEY